MHELPLDGQTLTEVRVMRTAKVIASACKKGMKTYWRWWVETSDRLGEHFQPW
jgi:hypothetical protein